MITNLGVVLNLKASNENGFKQEMQFPTKKITEIIGLCELEVMYCLCKRSMDNLTSLSLNCLYLREF